MKLSNRCPECGRPYPQDLPAAIHVQGPICQKLVNAVASRPDGIPRVQLFDAVYGSVPNPPGTLNVITMHVRLANQKLKAKGFRIWSSKGHGARYFLERLNGDPVCKSPQHIHP